jgi:glycosyltransferase involved in cell wall biosynthesis
MIAGSIDSVLAQTYPHFELIIVDDGSTDETPRIAAEYARRDPRVRVITQDNQKIPRALNRGFREARGEFLTWTSCDNRLKPAFCTRLVSCLQRHPCWDMAYANLDLIGEDGEYLRGTGYFEGYQRPWGSEHIFRPRRSSSTSGPTTRSAAPSCTATACLYSSATIARIASPPRTTTTGCA